MENKKRLLGSGGVLPQKIFKNLHTVVVILVLFEQFLCKFCLKFLPLNLSVSPSIMQFVRTFSIMRVLGVRHIVIEMVRNYGEIVLIKNMFWNAILTPPPLDPPLPTMMTMSLTTSPTSRVGFSMIEANSVTAVLK